MAYENWADEKIIKEIRDGFSRIEGLLAEMNSLLKKFLEGENRPASVGVKFGAPKEK